MSNILEDLWYGNIIPWEMFVRNNPRLKSLLSLACNNYDKLIAGFTEQQIKLLEEYKDSVNEMNCFTEQAAFQYSFSLGVKLLIEATNK